MHATYVCYSGAVTNIQIRDVPDPVVATIKAAAAARGHSLQRYVFDLLADHARVVTTAAVLDEAAADVKQADARPFDSIDVVREGREQRDERLLPTEPGPGVPDQRDR
jgi:plasmid stability protein